MATKSAASARQTLPPGTQISPLDTPTSLPAIPITPNVQTPSHLGVSSADLRGVTVTLWHPWVGQEAAFLKGILDEFNRSNTWGITVNAQGYAGFGSLDDALEAALASGTLPDVLIDYGNQARHWAGSDALVDLNSYITDPLWGLTPDEQADFLPAFWDETVAGGAGGNSAARLGMPYYRSAYVLFYNQSWAQALGYPNPPVTPEDLRVRACAAAESIARLGDKSNLGRGGLLLTSQPGALLGWIEAFGGRVTRADGNGYRFDSPETIQALEYLKGMQKGSCAWSDPTVDPLGEFANRHALFIVGSLLDVPAQVQAFSAAGSQDVWRVIAFPSDTAPVVDSYGPSLVLTRSTPARQLAGWLVMEWLVYPPHLAAWSAASGTLPTRQSALAYLTDAQASNPYLSQALELLPAAVDEPELASWRVVRWAVADALTQLIDPQVGADQIPAILQNLDTVSGEIFTQVR